MINLIKYELLGQDDSQILSKYFKVNDLQSKLLAGESNPVKVNQTCFKAGKRMGNRSSGGASGSCLSIQRFLILNS
jgi:hypothetical protein